MYSLPNFIIILHMNLFDLNLIINYILIISIIHWSLKYMYLLSTEEFEYPINIINVSPTSTFMCTLIYNRSISSLIICQNDLSKR
jgi:hypothetical protein